MTETDTRDSFQESKPRDVITMPGELKKEKVSESSEDKNVSTSEENTVDTETTVNDESEEGRAELPESESHVITFTLQDGEDVGHTVMPVLPVTSERVTLQSAASQVNPSCAISNTNHNHQLLNQGQINALSQTVQIEAHQSHQNFQNCHNANQTQIQGHHHQFHNIVSSHNQHSQGTHIANQVHKSGDQHNRVHNSGHQQNRVHNSGHQQNRVHNSGHQQNHVHNSGHQHRSRLEDEYSYLPATQIFLQNGTINPRYNHLFHSGYFMFRKQEAPWLANSLHIFGIAVDSASHYIVYIPVLGCEQSVPGSALSLNPSEPNPRYPKTFLACISGVSYIATRLRIAPEKNYNQEKHRQKLAEQQQLVARKQQHTGSSVKYVNFEPGTPETFSIFGVPVFKSQSYYVYIPEFSNEYTVPGIDLSPNPEDTSTLLVTIHRRRYHATSIRPVFPELVFHNKPADKGGEIGGESADKEIANELECDQSYKAKTDVTEGIGSETQEGAAEQSPQKQLLVYGIPVQPKETYYVYVPDMRQEYIVFGEDISPYDGGTFKITVDGTELVGTEVRPAFVRNNFHPGDRETVAPVSRTEEDSPSPPDKESRYKLVAFGTPIHPDVVYKVEVPGLGRSVEVLGNCIATNPENKDTILVEVDGVWEEGTSVGRRDEEDSYSNCGETHQLGGLISAFGVPVLPDEKYRVFVPILQAECLVYGRHIHSNRYNDQTILVIISGLQFEGTSLRTANSPNCPKYRVGTVVSSTERRNRAFRDREASGSDSTLSEDEKQEPLLDLNIRPPSDCLDLPKYVINSVAIFPESFYCVFIVKEEKEEKVIVKGSEFEPLIKDQQFFNIRVDGKLVFVEPYFRILPVKNGPEGPKTLSRNTNSAFGDFKTRESSERCNEL
ncbi:hypothetical protein ACHWQZ_G014603 [Mnemiopsis leidyi]